MSIREKPICILSRLLKTKILRILQSKKHKTKTNDLYKGYNILKVEDTHEYNL